MAASSRLQSGLGLCPSCRVARYSWRSWEVALTSQGSVVQAFVVDNHVKSADLVQQVVCLIWELKVTVFHSVWIYYIPA